MPLDLTCPKCQRVFPIVEARNAIGIECPKCDAELTVEFRNSPGTQPSSLRVSPGYPRSQAAFVLLRSKRKSAATRKRVRQIKSGSMLGVMLGSLVMLFVSLGGLGATGYYLFTNRPSGDVAAVDSSRGTRPTQPSPASKAPLNSESTGPTLSWKPDKFDLRPIVGEVPAIKPPTLEADMTTLDLTQFGGKVGAITVGGGGRYIIMHFPEKGILNAFDVSEGRFLGGVETDKGDVKLAAGLSWVITSPAGSTFRAFSLPTLQRRYDASIELFGGVGAMALGNRTDGPLLVTNPFGDVVLLDIGVTDLKEIPGSRKKPGIPVSNVRATPDGTAFLCYSVNFDVAQARNVKVLTESARDWVVTNLDPAVTIPGPDGNFYGSWPSPVDRLGQAVPMKATLGVNLGRTWFMPQITRSEAPLSQQGYFLRAMTFMRYVTVPQPVPQPAPQVAPPTDTVPGAQPRPRVVPPNAQDTVQPLAQPVAQPAPQPPAQPPPLIRQPKPSLSLTIHTAGNMLMLAPNTTAISALPEFDGMLEPTGAGRADFDQHFYLIPEAKLLVILSGDRTKLLVRKLNLQQPPPQP